MSSTVVSEKISQGAYSSFSLSRIWTLATNTVTQLLRMKILAFLVVFALIVVATAFAFPAMSAEQQLKMLKNVVFGALQVFSIIIAIAATALLLPRDVEDRTLYTILSKPVPRHEYLIGKLLGVILLLGAGLLIMDVFFSGVVWLKQSLITSAQIAAIQAQQGMTPDQVEQAKAYIAHYGVSWSLHAGVWCVFLKASVVASVALLLSCIASSTLFTIIVSFCFTIAGQGEGLLRSYVLKAMTVSWKKLCAFILAIICPDLTLFDLIEPAVRGDAIPLGILAEVSGFALLYIVLYTAIAYLIFVEKEL